MMKNGHAKKQMGKEDEKQSWRRLSQQREAFQNALVGSGDQPVVLRISVAGEAATTAAEPALPVSRWVASSRSDA